MDLTIEELAHELEHYQSYPDLVLDLTNPYLKAMSTFQSFTTDIIKALRRNFPEVTEHKESIFEIYGGLPSFFAVEDFCSWVKIAMLRHPLRRTEKQHQWLHIVQLQSAVNGQRFSVSSIILEAIAARADWRERVLNPENLFEDPDALYFFRRKNNLRDVENDPFPSGKEEKEQQCSICMERYDNGTHQPQQASCGHIHCKICLMEWLEKSQGRYTCPQCRACLVCNAQDCQHHVVDYDVAPPAPLNEFITDIDGYLLTYEGVDPYVLPSWVFSTREETRKDRGSLSFVRTSIEALRGQDANSLGLKGILTAQSIIIERRLWRIVSMTLEEKAAQFQTRIHDTSDTDDTV